MTFDITTANLPWVKPKEPAQAQNTNINLENIDTLYKTELSEGKRTTFEETFSAINDLWHIDNGYSYDEEKNAGTIDFKRQEEMRPEDDAKRFYAGLVSEKNKSFICKNMNIEEEEYDALACVALALATQETGMGFEEGNSIKDPGYQKENTNWFYKTIRDLGIKGANFLEKISMGGVEAHSASSGLTQLKIFDHMQSTEFISNWYNAYLEHLGVEADGATEDNLFENPEVAAAATMITLGSIMKHHSKYEATMEVYHDNLREHIQSEYGTFSSDALEKGYNHVVDIYNEYQTMSDDEKKEVRFAMKHWLLSQDGTTEENQSDDGRDYTEEMQLNDLNSHLPEDKQLTQESLDYIRYFLTDENMTMSVYEYLPYAWNKGTNDQPDRVMADQMGLILSDPEIYDYDQHTANVVAIAEKYADQATGGNGYYSIKDTLDEYEGHWFTR